MRTTITLADDVAAAVDRLRRERGNGPSEAVNELVRQGLTKRAPTRPFKQRTHHMGMLVDVSNVGEVLDLLDEADPRG